LDTSRRTAILVGVFFLISNVVFLLGSFVFVEPILGDPEYLTLASENSSQVTLGALLEISNGVAYLGIGVLMFSILGRRFRSMALWYVAFRVIEFVMQTLSDLSALSLVKVSGAFVGSGAAAAPSYQAVGTLLLAGRSWAFQMVSIALVLGALVFYFMLYRTKLIPRFISVWGFIAALFVISTALLDIFGVNVESLEFLGVFMLLNEVFLGFWLIVKGFEPSAVNALSEQTSA
jgi:hypothetical protein